VGSKAINGQPGICLRIVKFLQNLLKPAGGATQFSKPFKPLHNQQFFLLP
jgi:hypothetical protein